jgi:FKBP-type peptidyl-prolyl cis-trans isomerase FkpA
VQNYFKAVAGIIFGSFVLVACGQQNAPADESAVAAAATEATATATEQAAGVTELQITDLVAGDGATASSGQNVVVHYTGWLYQPGEPDNKGQKFDSSVDRGEPFVFPLGGGRVIQGWDQGVAGMKIGGKRILVIPPEMGYGARGAGGVIPPNATLIFEVDLLEIQ